MKILRELRAKIWTIVLAIGVVLAAMAATRERAKSRAWQDQAAGQAEDDRDQDLLQGQAALDRAKIHDTRAEAAIAAAQSRLDQVGARDETVADIVHGWTADRLRNKSSK